MATLDGNWQYLGYNPESGPAIITYSSYASRLYLQARVKSYNTSDATITARVSIRNSWVGWRSYNTVIGLSGASSYKYVDSGGTRWEGAYADSGSASYVEIWSAEYDFNVSYGTFNLGAYCTMYNGTATIGNQSCTVNAPAPTTWTVSYNANGGTGAPASQTKTQNVALTLSSTKPTRASVTTQGATVTFSDDWGRPTYSTYTTVAATITYTFKDWNTKADGSGTTYASGGSYTANEGATLYAQWISTETADGKVKFPSSLPGNVGSFKYFVGWTTTKNDKSTLVQDGYVAISDITLYAYWEDVNSKFKYLNNGSWDIL